MPDDWGISEFLEAAAFSGVGRSHCMENCANSWCTKGARFWIKSTQCDTKNPRKLYILGKKSIYSLCLEFSLKPGLAWAAEPLIQLWFLSYFWDILNILHVGLREQIITCQQWAGLQTNCWKNKFKSSHPFFSQIWEPWNSTLHILSSPETRKGLPSDPKARLDLPGRIKLLQLCHLLKSSLAVTSCYATLTRGSTVPTCQTPSLHVLMP